MSEVLIGCDPEGFLVDKSGDFISAYGIIPGTKDNPYELDGGAVQVDGMALEFNIHPAKTDEEFNSNIKKVLSQINEMIHLTDKDIDIKWTPIARFKSTIWEMSPEQCKILGCDPDFNIDGEVNDNPINIIGNSPIRTAAGHIHIGWLETFTKDPSDPTHFNLCNRIAKHFYFNNLKYYAPVVADEFERLKYYGNNGSFRPKKYGVELRSPSNRWVVSEESRKEIFNITRNSFRDITYL